MNKLLQIFLVTVAGFILVSCSSDNTGKCSFISDQVSVVDQKSMNGKHFYLVRRVSGWHDKSVFVEVYDQDPAFNYCGLTNVTPLASRLLERDVALKVIFIPESHRIRVLVSGEYPGHSNPVLVLETP